MQCVRIFVLIAIFVLAAFLFGCAASAPQDSNADKSNGAGLANAGTQATAPGQGTGAASGNSAYSISFKSNYTSINKTISGTIELDMANREFCIINTKKDVAMCVLNRTYYLITIAGRNCSGTYLKYNDDALLDAKRCSLVANAPVFKDQLYPFVFTLCKNYSSIVNENDTAEYLRMRNEIGSTLSTRLNSSGTEVLLQYAGVDGLAMPSSLEWKENGETVAKTTYVMLGKTGRIRLIDGLNSTNCALRDAAGAILEVN